MKKLFFIAISVISLTSCKKEIYGCTDSAADNYSAVATKDDGSCFFQSPNSKSTTVTISSWTQNLNEWVTIIPYGEITQNTIDNGAVITYMENGVNSWMSLPLTIYESVDYSTSIKVSFTVGQVIVSYSNSDETLPTEPGQKVFKVVVI